MEQNLRGPSPLNTVAVTIDRGTAALYLWQVGTPYKLFFCNGFCTLIVRHRQVGPVSSFLPITETTYLSGPEV